MIKTAVIVNQGGLSTQVDYDNYEVSDYLITFTANGVLTGVVNLEDVSFIKIIEGETVH